LIISAPASEKAHLFTYMTRCCRSGRGQPQLYPAGIDFRASSAVALSRKAFKMNSLLKTKIKCSDCVGFKSIVESSAYKEAMTLKSLVGYDNIIRVKLDAIQILCSECETFARRLDDDFCRLDYDKMYGNVKVLLVATIIYRPAGVTGLLSRAALPYVITDQYLRTLDWLREKNYG
jgi:hypothetical protein